MKFKVSNYIWDQLHGEPPQCRLSILFNVKMWFQSLAQFGIPSQTHFLQEASEINELYSQD